jgi:YVTN family beta-propeller protein
MRWMNRAVLGAVAGAMLFGCNNPQQQLSSAASGSLALSADDQLLYAADTDNGVLTVIDTRSDTAIANVKVGTRPSRVVVGSDDTIYVGNRGSRSVSVIHRGDWREAAQIPTGVDPTGLAVSLDGKTLYVVNATAKDTTDYGTLQAVDTTSLTTKWELPVGTEPRAIALLPGNKAVITQYRGGTQGAELVSVDLDAQQVTSPSTGIYGKVNYTQSLAAGSPTGYSTFDARAMTDAVATPDGKRVFVPTVWAREDAIGKEPAAGGYYAQGGPCNVGSVATAGIVTAEVGGSNGNNVEPNVDDLTDCVTVGTTSASANFPPTAQGYGASSSTIGASVDPGKAVQGPVAMAVDPTGEWLYVVNRETSNVSIMPAWRRTARGSENINYTATGNSIRDLVAVNADPSRNNGADGIALTKDGTKAYVYSQFDHEVILLGPQNPNDPNGPIGSDAIVTVKSRIATGLQDPAAIAGDIADGRRWFFDAMNTQLSSDQTHVSCATCHLEGRDDAHTWVFPDGHRQTPALVGRMITETAPYHWSGQFATFTDFMSHTVQKRMGGSGTSDTINQHILSFLANEPAPENANVGATLTPAQLHGQQVFGQAGCGTCHNGAALTNKTEQAVGTWNNDDNVLNQAFDVPSLLGLARTAPYLHDGRYQTLSERVNDGNVAHGNLAGVSDQDRKDLVEYLKTL